MIAGLRKGGFTLLGLKSPFAGKSIITSPAFSKAFSRYNP